MEINNCLKKNKFTKEIYKKDLFYYLNNYFVLYLF